MALLLLLPSKESTSEGKAKKQNTILLPKEKILDIEEEKKIFFKFSMFGGGSFCYPSSLWSTIAVRSCQDILRVVVTNKWESERKNTKDLTHEAS